MLKVKNEIQKNTNKNQEDEITQLRNEIKNSIKNLFISDQKEKKTTDEYAQLLTKIREEYGKLQQENDQLKIEIQKYWSYIEQSPQNSYCQNYQKPIRKRKHYYDHQDNDESQENNSYVTEIRRGPKEQKKRRIIYEGKIDGLPEYEPDLPLKKGKKKTKIMKYKKGLKENN